VGADWQAVSPHRRAKVDNLTLDVGLTLVRAGVGRDTRRDWRDDHRVERADLDIISAITGGAVPYLAAHRGPTHGPLGIVGLAVASAVIVWTILKWRGPRETVTAALLGRLIAVALVGSTLLVLMDLPTSYGVRLFSPFSTTWYAVDWLPIIDIYLWALWASAWRDAAAQSGGRGSRVSCSLVSCSSRGTRHRAASRAGDRRRARADGARGMRDGARVVDAPGGDRGTAGWAGRVPAGRRLPTFLSPLTWQLIASRATATSCGRCRCCRLGGVDAVVDPERERRVGGAARRTHTARVFLNFEVAGHAVGHRSRRIAPGPAGGRAVHRRAVSVGPGAAGAAAIRGTVDRATGAALRGLGP
jgi:hypothetical protein